jgi:hypothetical protein
MAARGQLHQPPGELHVALDPSGDERMRQKRSAAAEHIFNGEDAAKNLVEFFDETSLSTPLGPGRLRIVVTRPRIARVNRVPHPFRDASKDQIGLSV